MACINDIPYEILLKGGSPTECENLIRENSDEVYYVKGGYKLRGVTLSGEVVPIGIKGNDIFFQFIKPCFGLFVLKTSGSEADIEDLRRQPTTK
ncbi:DUF1894 domain-containing protein [Methanolobus sp. ZRKC3]|uniref:DUF1894 domain-containing protein n=1 Tax=Methanolobus sp. ZRKC3 TaxID=3125786 RepID=UPI00325406F1